MKTLTVGFALAMLMTSGVAAAQPSTGSGPGPGQRRAIMEAQVMRAVVQRISNELMLDAATSERLLVLFQEGEAQRRALFREGMELNQRLRRALNDPNTPEGEFHSIVDGLGEVRRRELELWQNEHDALREFLTPRQHAQFIALRNRFNRAVVDAVQRRRPGLLR